jgi:hypothetical protein
MKKLISILTLAALSLATAVAQKNIDVVSKDYEVEKIKRTGLSVTIELSEKVVSDLWKKQIKEYGKVESKKNVYWIEVANIPAISGSPVKLYSATEGSGKGTMVWLAIDMGDKHVVEGGEGYAAAKKFLRDFAISCYKADLEDQIKEAEKAFSSAEKTSEKVIKEGEKLVSNLENNASEKIKLEEAIKKNASDKVQLEKDQEQNKKDQSSAKADVEKMKKALEIKQGEMTLLK